MTKILTGLLASVSILLNGVSAGLASPPTYKLSFNKSRGENFEKSKSSGHRNKGYTEFDLHNQQNFYSVELQVGTPAQDVVVLLDTGSSDLWVTGDGNPYCSPKTRHAHLKGTRTSDDVDADSTEKFPGISATIDCSLYGTFSSKDSKSFKSNDSTFMLKYGDGSFTKGVWGMDKLHLDGLNISDVSFAVADETNSSVGVLGIGLPGDEATVTPGSDGNHYQYKNLPQILKENRVIHKVAYSLYLDSPQSSHGSILFGAVDRSKYTGKLYTLPIVNVDASEGVPPRRFDVALHGMSLTNSSSNTTVSSDKILALLDSGTTLMYLPTKWADSLAHSLGGKFSTSGGYYVIPKPSKHQLSNTRVNFDFGGFHIKTSLSNYVLDVPGLEDFVALGVLRTENNAAILGDVFLTDAYVVYNLEDYEISLAQANFNSTAKSDIKSIYKTVPGASRAPGYTSRGSDSSIGSNSERKRQKLIELKNDATPRIVYSPLGVSVFINLIIICILL